MPTATNSAQSEVHTETRFERRLHRSNTQRVIAGVCGGLGEYFALDPIWFRIGFVVLALGGGSGILIYLVMWLVIQPAPNGHVSSPPGQGALSGAAVVGAIFMIVGTIALANTIAPWMGQYIWPVVFVLFGLALVIGGLNRDNH